MQAEVRYLTLHRRVGGTMENVASEQVLEMKKIRQKSSNLDKEQRSYECCSHSHDHSISWSRP